MQRLLAIGRLVWELPQSALGVAVLGAELAVGSARSVERRHGRLFVESSWNAVSLGYVVFWRRRSDRYFALDEHTREHEYGHTFQSRLLGPLYLPLVGVPSALRVLFAIAYREITGRRWAGYFDGYPERWADSLGGVDRRAQDRAAAR